jgi:putative salt-induced outer membrane protein YdiY
MLPKHFTHLLTGSLSLAVVGITAFSVSAPPAHAQATTNAAGKWAKSAAVGATVTGGNTETILLSGKADAQRKWERYELSLGADGAYGVTERRVPGGPDVDETTAQSLRGFLQYNRLFTPRFYGYLRQDAIHDKIGGVDYRLITGGGVGYYVVKEPATTFRTELGGAFVYERVTVDPGVGVPPSNKYDRYATVRLAERLDHKFNDRFRIWQSAEILPEIGNWENYIVNAEVGLESALTDSLSLLTYLQDTYDNEPPLGRVKNDWKWVTALAWKF